MNKIFTVILLIIFINGYSQNRIDVRIYEDFERNSITKNETDRILVEVVNTFAAVQECISDIASKSLPNNERIRLKSKALTYFESSNSIIEVTNLKSGETIRRYISDYLERLMNLHYYKVTLYWDENLAVSKLFVNGSGNYEIGIGCWQYFVARNEEGLIVYSDKTYKKSFFSITKDYDSNWSIKINEIKADETKLFNINPDYK